MRTLLERTAQLVSRICSVPRTAVFRAVALGGGAVLFLAVVPWLLLVALRPLTLRSAAAIPRGLELAAGVPAIAAGLALCLWVTVVFWRAGGGTPAPVAAPQRLVVTGPFRCCRNPLKLGAITFYLGVGALAASLATGVAMFLAGLALGSLYHRFIEENELRLRFGEPYEAYRRRTPFIFPRWPR